MVITAGWLGATAAVAGLQPGGATATGSVYAELHRKRSPNRRQIWESSGGGVALFDVLYVAFLISLLFLFVHTYNVLVLSILIS